MDVIELLPRLHLLRFPVGQAYLWRDDEELTLIDAGAVGSGRTIADAITALGRAPGDVRRIVLTHFHEDHAGGAGEFAALSGAEVLAHRLDAPFVRGERPGPPPRFEEWELPVHAEVSRWLPEGEPVVPPSVTPVSDGEVLGFGGGARVVHVPGHTDGSIAVLVPDEGVLFTGDTVAASPVDATVMPGVFNLDRRQLLDSLDRLASLDAEVACFGHGDPVLVRASAALRRATDNPTATG
ncbi:glyoxylase-like metal-dependent hydrolase (beta-lactamase superfamily II) [Streptomyces griseochromogenes]|uniref:Glyoxylase-like metal-dependent hydrolase (Beta-lactamase superfamily II) n=1 Tax=Streptomyces griseochromogenes TaxID=68214 RepID=A0A1B1B303_9ACTN|nr:MBL fold metallo-hydrolase [Streptomyces griseochromogenes]ANP53193.1 MBL fold metallo-hydrolase [Streptomyces griseochromogenes]MBP2053890.1 glyoxylase-like metal-dependent hydrolase (beta-lactamase superfamily II) [Streptomyces griseochromogenes]